jgi:hypothetical protein
MFLALLSLSLASALEYTQQEFTFKQILNHFVVPYQLGDTYDQRYWIVDDYWDKTNGPVFLYVCGEAECHGVNPARSYPLLLAQEHKARFVVLEHRYYGYSLPLTKTKSLPPLLLYLNTEQALADIEYFIHSMNNDIIAERGGEAPKWLIMGGSYPGALAAFFRTKNPDLVVGAWASSAVVKPILDFSDFDKQMYLSAMKSGQSCVDAIREVTAYVDEMYDNEKLTTVMDIFGVTEAFAFYDLRPFLFYFSDIIVAMIQYGRRVELCNTFTSTTDNIERLKDLKALGEKYNVLDTRGYAPTQIQSLKWEHDSNGRQWFWQTCTQFGWFQTPSEYKMRSARLDINFWEWYCNVAFDFPGGLKLADMDVTIAKFPWRGTKILFTNGDEDPWKWASVMEQESDDRPVIMMTCDDCGHVTDFKNPSDTDPDSVKEAKEQIRTIIAEFLS